MKLFQNREHHLYSILISYELEGSKENSIIIADIAGVVSSSNHHCMNIPGIVLLYEGHGRTEKKFFS